MEREDGGGPWTCPLCGCRSAMPPELARFGAVGLHTAACAWCATYAAQDRGTTMSRVFMAGLLILTIACVVLGEERAGPLPTLVLAVWSIYGLVLLHELMHAAASVLLGGRVHAIVLGHGRRWFRIRLGHLHLDFHARPAPGGGCLESFDDVDAPGFRNRVIAVLVAPHVMHLALILWALLAPGEMTLFRSFVVLVNAVLMAISSRDLREIGGPPGDLIRAWALLRDDAELDDERRVHLLTAATAAWERGEFPRAAERVRDALARWPTNQNVLDTTLTVFWATEDFDTILDALDRAAPLPARAESSPDSHAALNALGFPELSVHAGVIRLLRLPNAPERFAALREWSAQIEEPGLRPWALSGYAAYVLFEPVDRLSGAELSDAKKAAMTALELAPWDPKVQLAAALAHLRGGDVATARRARDEMRRRERGFGDADSGVLDVYFDVAEGRLDTARRTRDRIVRRGLGQALRKCLDGELGAFDASRSGRSVQTAP